MDTRAGADWPNNEERRGFLRAGLRLAPIALATSLAQAQTSRAATQEEEPEPRRLPDGELQTEAILKAEYVQNVKDAREMTALAKSIELDFDKNDQNVLSLGLLKKLDEMEKITRRIRGRVKK